MKTKVLEWPIGTVVMLTYPDPVYAIVIDRVLWLKNANEESDGDVNNFLEGERKYGKGMMMPLFFLGDVVGSKLVVIDKEPVEKRYVQKYAYSNTGGHIHIIGSVSRLLNIIWHIQHHAKGSLKYVESAFYDAEALEIYLDGHYDLASDCLSPAYKNLIKLFEKALPGLAGKESREA